MRTSSGLGARDLALVAVFAAMIVALGLPGTIAIGSSGVPITLQTLGVMLAGALLGAKRGTLAVLTVIVVGLALPVLAGGRTTLTSLSGATAGFLLGWIPAAAVIGWLTALTGHRFRIWLGTLINVLGGVLILYACGLAGMMLRLHMSFGAAVSANAPFLPGDVVKAVVTAGVTAAVLRAYPAAALRRAPTLSEG